VQKGIGIFTKSVKFADFPSAETAKPCSGLPPLLAQAAFPPAPSAYLRRRNIGQETARIVQMKKIRKNDN